jgi:hypothetical protein
MAARTWQRSRQALPVLLVGIGMCAMVAVVSVHHLSSMGYASPVALLGSDASMTVSATAAGFGALGSVGKHDRANVLGTLGDLAARKPVVNPAKHAAAPKLEGSFAANIAKMAAADAQRHGAAAAKAGAAKMAKAEKIEQKATALEEEAKHLREEEARVKAAARKEKAAYSRAMEQASKASSSAQKALHTEHAAKAAKAAKAPVVAASDAGAVAKEVASMVMSAIEPELQAQQAEIAKLADARGKEGADEPKKEKAESKEVTAEKHVEKHAEKFPPAFPEHFAKVKAQQQTTHLKSKKHDSFQAELSRFMDTARPYTYPAKKVKTLQKTEIPGKRVHGNRKSQEDYKIPVEEDHPSASDAGEGAYGHGEEAEWLNEHAKGSPCNTAGACTHYAGGHVFNLQDHEHWRKHFLKRYKKACEDGNGNLLEGEEPCVADDEDAEEKPDEIVKIGDEQLMRSLDDYVPPSDAYIHNLLTSGTYGVDHFGHLAPMSSQNYDLMYGEDSKVNIRHAFGHDIHSPGRGGLDHVDREDRADDVKLGDDQIGDDDEEVPTALTMPMFPGPDPDHFDHWYWESPLNQELLNGKYWKRLKKDGMMDRIMPAKEAYSHQIGDGHDRHPLPDLVVGSWNQGFGYGPSKEEPLPFEHARKETHGEHWKDRVFTGTHEDMEMEKGVVSCPCLV